MWIELATAVDNLKHLIKKLRKTGITAEKSWPLRDEYQAAQLLQEDNQAADADVGIDHVAKQPTRYATKYESTQRRANQHPNQSEEEIHPNGRSQKAIHSP